MRASSPVLQPVASFANKPVTGHHRIPVMQACALANVAPHARASKAEVTACGDSTLLVVEFTTTGSAAHPPAAGSGLTGLADRVAALVDPLQRLSDRERAALTLMAEGRSNVGIAGRLYLSPKSVERHVAGVFDKLGLPPDSDDNRRVLAVIIFLRTSA
jgi:DNA-binding NarL/FixJ family response regulator